MAAKRSTNKKNDGNCRGHIVHVVYISAYISFSCPFFDFARATLRLSLCNEKNLNKRVLISTVVDDWSTVVHMPRLHGHHMLSHFGGALNADTSALSSTSVPCQIWKSTSIHE